MYNRYISLIGFLALIGFLSLVASCGSGGGGGVAGSAPGATLSSISLSPQNSTIAKGATQQFTAKGTYSDGSMHDITSQVTWTSLNQTIASMSTSTVGLASGAAQGDATVKASVGAINDTTTLHVLNPTLVAIVVSPANVTIAKNLTRQFTATGMYTPTLVQDITSQVTWTTSSAGIATMSTTTSGLALGISGGSTTITATDLSTAVTGTTTATVRSLMGGAVQDIALTLSNSVSTVSGSSTIYGHLDGTGAGASFSEPTAVTTDGTNLYIADTQNHTIRKIVIATGAVTTLAGTAPISGAIDATGVAARFSNPYGITTDGINLYVADTYNHLIRKIVIETGEVTTLAGIKNYAGSADGTGTAASFYYPYAITTDGTNLFVADTYNNTIRQIVISTREVTTLAGFAGNYGTLDGTGSSARFRSPAGITTDGTYLYVADTGSHTIRKVVIATGAVTTFAGGPGSTGSTNGVGLTARFYNPNGITMDGTNLYVADTQNHTIRKVVISTADVTTPVGLAATSGSADGTGSAARFSHPYGVVTDGTSLYVGDAYNHTIRLVQ